MIKVLFVLENLCVGGAERVLVNLINNMDNTIFDVTLLLLFDKGPLIEQIVKEKGISVICKKHKKFKGIKTIYKFIPKRLLYNHYIKNNLKEDFDVVIAYMTGIPTFVVSGASSKTKKIAWLHGEFGKDNKFKYLGLKRVYDRFDKVAGVSNYVCGTFNDTICSKNKAVVVHNTNDIEKIITLSKQKANVIIDKNCISIVSVGCLENSKGYDRLINVSKQLISEGRNIKVYIIGDGILKNNLLSQIRKNELENYIYLLGYQENPYNILIQCDMFICSSRTEGLSTAVTEALLLGLPIVSTEVSGAREILGDSEYGIICESSSEGIYLGILDMLKEDTMKYYRERAKIRSKNFETKNIVYENEKIIKECFLNQ